MGRDEVAVSSPKVIKRDFRACEWLVRESGKQAIFSSLLPVESDDIARNRQPNLLIHGSMAGVIDRALAFLTTGLLASDGIYL